MPHLMFAGGGGVYQVALCYLIRPGKRRCIEVCCGEFGKRLAAGIRKLKSQAQCCIHVGTYVLVLVTEA